ncbi:MAG: LTA synthase family protein, partial [Pseudoflavonifractor sp.]
MACHPPADTNMSSGGVPPEERRQPLEYRLRQKRRAFTERLAALRARLRHTHAPWRDNALVWWLLVLLTPVLLVLCAQLVALADGKAVALWFAACSEAAFLTYVLLLALEVLLLVLTGSLFVPTLMLSAVVLFLAIANHFKEAINGVPLMVSDIAMVGNVGDVADFLRPGMKLGAGIWQAVGIVAVLLVLTAIFALHPRVNRRGWRVRLKTAIACVLVLVLSASYIPTRAFLDGTETDEAQAERNDRLGLLAGLYSGVLDSAVQEPNAYNENNMNGILMQVMHNAKPTPERTVQPNVILLMSESFCDPTVVLPGVEFHDDPIPNYHALARDWPSGTFQSNTYAGGTGNVEMEVMTGLPIGFLSESEDLTALADADSYDRVPSIVKAFAADGYATEFVHSYTPNLYHRTENLPKIGFQKVLFQDDFPKNEERKAGYLSDRALNRKLISEFEGREKDKPLLMFGLSVENHQPYFTGKFDTPSGVDFSCSELDTDGVGALDTLLHGIHDADEALGQL